VRHPHGGEYRAPTAARAHRRVLKAKPLLPVRSRAVAGLTALLVLVAGTVRAQDSLAVAPDSAVAWADSALRQVPDSLLKPPVRPLGAFIRSFLIPGWGQAKLGRNMTAALFIAAEGVTLGMTLKTTQEIHHLEDIDSPSVDSKRSEQQDWIVLLVLNHLVAGLEAYVSAHLWDFPGDLKLEAAPGGGYDARVSIPLNVR
jgi:hypothetical protein